MKNTIGILVLLSLFTISCGDKVDVEKDKEAIIKVIEDETAAYYEQDFDRLSKTYVQDETNVRLTAYKSHYYHLNGWQAVGDSLKSSIDKWTEDEWGKFKNFECKKSNYKIKVYPKSAWAIFDEVTQFEYDSTVHEYPSVQVRFLEKNKGKWEIVYLSVVGTASYDVQPKDLDTSDWAIARKTY